MKIGMLWTDFDKHESTAGKISKAVSYYTAKYGERPNVCYVHPSTIIGEGIFPVPVAIRTDGYVQPNNFWIGVEEQ